MADQQFEMVGQTPWPELEGMLRDVPLLNEPDIRPYAEATMSIERFGLYELASTTRYVQSNLVAVQGLIRASLLPLGYDQLDLSEGGIIIDGGNGPQRIIPPIVERFEEDGESKYILDGAHRAQLAKEVNEDPLLTVIYIRDGITHPPYAFINPWREVRLTEDRPADKSIWKNYRDFPNRYDLYRDFSQIVGSTPRGLEN